MSLAAAALTLAAPVRAAGPVRVMQFNVCGAICNHGMVSRPGGGNDLVDDVAGRIAANRPAIVTLNEVCIGQFGRLKAALAGAAWKMSGTFRAQRSDGRCPGGFGDAVFSAAGISGPLVFPLFSNGGEHRAVLCVRTGAGGGPVLACVLHLVTGNPLKARELAVAARAVNGAATTGAVIVGGDFNTTPGGMQALVGPSGRFFDVDPQAAPTRGQKIDYVLFDRAHFTGPTGGPVGSTFSDHDPLVGQATRR